MMKWANYSRVFFVWLKACAPDITYIIALVYNPIHITPSVEKIQVREVIVDIIVSNKILSVAVF